MARLGRGIGWGLLAAGAAYSLALAGSGPIEYFSRPERMGAALTSLMFSLWVGAAGASLFGIPLYLKIRAARSEGMSLRREAAAALATAAALGLFVWARGRAGARAVSRRRAELEMSGRMQEGLARMRAELARRRDAHGDFPLTLEGILEVPEAFSAGYPHRATRAVTRRDAIATEDSGTWAYFLPDRLDSEAKVWIDCTHTDASMKQWGAY